MSKTNKNQNRPENGTIDIISMLKKYSIPLAAGLIIGLLMGLPVLFWGTSIVSPPKAEPEDTVNQDTTLQQDTTLLFVGGGSVISYLDSAYSTTARDSFPSIEDTTNRVFSKNQYPNSMYLHMSSGEALSVLVEEAIMPESIKDQKFYPVCLSAMKAVDSMFTKTCTEDQITKAGKIVEYYLGEDRLVIYAHNLKELDSVREGSQTTKITMTQLRELLRKKKKSYKIFTTSELSGTYYSYNEKIRENNSINDTIDLDSIKDKKFFSSQSSLEYFSSSGQSYIILGTELYYPKELIKNRIVRKLYLVGDDMDSYYTHHLYLYFMAYNMSNLNNEFRVPKSVLEFLKKVLKFEDKSSMLIEKNRLSQYGSLIIPLNPPDDHNTKN